MKPAIFDHLHPTTTSEALTALAEGGKIMGGGQSLGPMLNLRLARPGTVIGLSAIPGLADIREEKGQIILGAGVTHARIEDNDCAIDLPPMLRHVARGIAYRAVRNRGTVGGSIAHADPAADWISAMTALDAQLLLQGAGGKQRRLPVAGFMLGAYRTQLAPAEIITSVEIRSDMRNAHWGYYKICRKVGEFADAIGALVIHPETGFIRLLAGATGAQPLVLTELGASIAASARHPGEPAIREALAAQLPGLDPVKLHLMTTALGRCIEKVIPA
ncbi:MAG: FAD binding domain-containing protein [Paracoccus sp. (in: a-proteobacteria)]